MNSRTNRVLVSPVDHVIRSTLRRQVERSQPSAEVKARLMQRAAERSLLQRLSVMFSGEEPEYYIPQARTDISLGWHVIVLAQTTRPVGVFSALSGLLR